MKNTYSLMILSLMAILMLGVVSADIASTTTVIAGKIYNSDYTDVIAGADVTVTCGTGEGSVMETTSFADGAYKVEYFDLCIPGDTLTVYAEKDDLSGTKTGTIKVDGECSDPNTENCLINIYEGLDVAVVNVPLVPEFGAVIGVLTVLGALGVFFFVRKK